jgi:hypothetical protein
MAAQHSAQAWVQRYPTLKQASLSYFREHVQEALQALIPDYTPWHEDMLNAHQLPACWQVTCISQSIERALDAYHSASEDEVAAAELQKRLQIWS